MALKQSYEFDEIPTKQQQRQKIITLCKPIDSPYFFYFFDRFRSLEAEEAFNIACCDEKVQNSILSKDFQHEFSKVCDLESEINFKFYDDSKAAVTKESRKKDKEDKKEAKRLKLLRREEKKTKIEADIKAKMDKNQNDNSEK